MTATTTLILGGGFGGISAANSLRRLLPQEHQIIVIDKSTHFHVVMRDVVDSVMRDVVDSVD